MLIIMHASFTSSRKAVPKEWRKGEKIEMEWYVAILEQIMGSI